MSDRHPEIEREERAIYIIIMVALSPVVLAALAALYERGVAIDGGTTLSFLIVALGVLGLVTRIRAMRSQLPRTHVHHRRRPR